MTVGLCRFHIRNPTVAGIALFILFGRQKMMSIVSVNCKFINSFNPVLIVKSPTPAYTTYV